MGYGTHDRQAWGSETATAADVLTALGDAAATFAILRPLTIIRVGALITVAVGGDSASVAFDRRITFGSDTGRIDAALGTLILPANTAAGKIVYKDSDPAVDVDAGDEVVPEVTEVSAGGAARYFVEYIDRDEVALNQADMVLSS